MSPELTPGKYAITVARTGGAELVQLSASLGVVALTEHLAPEFVQKIVVHVRDNVVLPLLKRRQGQPASEPSPVDSGLSDEQEAAALRERAHDIAGVLVRTVPSVALELSVGHIALKQALGVNSAQTAIVQSTGVAVGFLTKLGLDKLLPTQMQALEDRLTGVIDRALYAGEEGKEADPRARRFAKAVDYGICMAFVSALAEAAAHTLLQKHNGGRQ